LLLSSDDLHLGAPVSGRSRGLLGGLAITVEVQDAVQDAVVSMSARGGEGGVGALSRRRRVCNHAWDAENAAGAVDMDGAGAGAGVAGESFSDHVHNGMEDAIESRRRNAELEQEIALGGEDGVGETVADGAGRGVLPVAVEEIPEAPDDVVHLGLEEAVLVEELDVDVTLALDYGLGDSRDGAADDLNLDLIAVRVDANTERPVGSGLFLPRLGLIVPAHHDCRLPADFDFQGTLTIDSREAERVVGLAGDSIFAIRLL